MVLDKKTGALVAVDDEQMGRNMIHVVAGAAAGLGAWDMRCATRRAERKSSRAA